MGRGQFVDSASYLRRNGRVDDRVEVGQRSRIGIAPGNKITTLTIPGYLIIGTSYLRFIASPLAGNRSPVSEEINVSPGDQLVMIINQGG